MPLLAVPADKSNFQSVGVFLTGLAAAIALLYYGRGFCITLVVSVMLAFLLEPLVALFMRARVPRGVASFLVCSIALFGLYLFGFALFTQLGNFADDLPEYSRRLNLLIDRASASMEQAEQELYRAVIPQRLQPKTPQPEPPVTSVKRKRSQAAAVPAAPPPIPEVRIQQDRSSLMNYVVGYVSSFYHTLLMISFVPFLVYFSLSWRDHISRTLLAIYDDSERARAWRSWRGISDMARAYVAGNVILGVIISLVSCVVFFSWGLPYWILIGFISGFLSLIPYVGLPLAIIPAVLSSLMTYDAVTPYVIICTEIAAIHLLALNLLYPAVVGARVHLNPLTVTVALMFWGTIWGGIGLILAIPMTAALKAFLDNTESLQGYGRLLGDEGKQVHSAGVD